MSGVQAPHRPWPSVLPDGFFLLKREIIMSLMLGIDTGGTFTDAVLYSEERGVIASSKSVTTKHDLSLGIEKSLSMLPSDAIKTVDLVSLSTTLATNAIVEGYESRICMMLIGYEEEALFQAGLAEALADNPYVFIDGGHNVDGDEKKPLDLERVEKTVEVYKNKVNAFAVSGYFSVRNPVHEIEVKNLIKAHTDLPVTCGHELTSNLHATRRALTTAFNARLIPLIKHLIEAVQKTMDKYSITAPLMVVKGDGSLVKSEFAFDYPVETILSGPAASVVGARKLTGQDNAFVVDMGGTTTDIAILTGGSPNLDKNGASIGSWQTMVEAVEIFTVGLGGDSRIELDQDGLLKIGPRRVIPISYLADQHPDIRSILEKQAAKKTIEKTDGVFLISVKRNIEVESEYREEYKTILERIGSDPVALTDLFEESKNKYILEKRVDELIGTGILARAGFTPTDACHVLRKQKSWDRESAVIAAGLFLKTINGYKFGDIDTIDQLSEIVIDTCEKNAAKAIIEATVFQTSGIKLSKGDPGTHLLLDSALDKNPAHKYFGVNVSLHHPIVSIGAPVKTYFPPIASLLGTSLVIPEFADVANAVGAVAGNVVQRIHVKIIPHINDDSFRVHTPGGIEDFEELQQAIDFAESVCKKLAEEKAHQAGAHNIQCYVSREDHKAQTSGDFIYIGSDVIGTASGRPSII
jgi:N-methylhydantoinase A/oxoprolinase/acetone carboxylase beta subunit